MDEATFFMLVILAALAYVMVTCILGSLASHVKHARDRHELVREARLRRQAYLDKLHSDDENDDVQLV